MPSTLTVRLHRVRAFVKEHNIDCEFTVRPTLDLCLSEEFVGYAKKAFEDARAGGVNVDHITVLDQEAAQKAGRTDRAFYGYQWEASSLNPLKLAHGVYRQCLSHDGFGLFAYTPATSVTANEGDDKHQWLISTPRGNIAATKVVYATNGYTKLLLPELQDIIWGYQGEASVLSAR